MHKTTEDETPSVETDKQTSLYGGSLQRQHYDIRLVLEASNESTNPKQQLKASSAARDSRPKRECKFDDVAWRDRGGKYC